ncbi:thermonuclease family protein, partial [Acidisphaera rubrifaciens]|uniref:thermonuclease family protein n=1 Tax=Acidisphaera rubrifaciens TaxID=50715 RepID=UPI00066275DE
SLVRARPVDCRIAGADRMGHPLGVCEASGQQINRALVAAGYARADTPGRDAEGLRDIGLQAADLRSDETQARAQRRGLWAGGADTSW